LDRTHGISARPRADPDLLEIGVEDVLNELGALERLPAAA
jgi:hypothetical protein